MLMRVPNKAVEKPSLLSFPVSNNRGISIKEKKKLPCNKAMNSTTISAAVSSDRAISRDFKQERIINLCQ